MTSFSNELWFLIAILVGACALAALHVLALFATHQTKVHDLRVRVAKLQAEQAAHLQAIAERNGDSDVIVLNEVPVHAPKPHKHAA